MTGCSCATCRQQICTLESALHQAAILANAWHDRAELAEAELAGAKARAERAEAEVDSANKRWAHHVEDRETAWKEEKDRADKAEAEVFAWLRCAIRADGRADRAERHLDMLRDVLCGAGREDLWAAVAGEAL